MKVSSLFLSFFCVLSFEIKPSEKRITPLTGKINLSIDFTSVDPTILLKTPNPSTFVGLGCNRFETCPQFEFYAGAIRFVIPKPGGQPHTTSLASLQEYVRLQQMSAEEDYTADKELAEPTPQENEAVTNVKEVFKLYFQGKEEINQENFVFSNKYIFEMQQPDGERHLVFFPHGYDIIS